MGMVKGEAQRMATLLEAASRSDFSSILPFPAAKFTGAFEHQGVSVALVKPCGSAYCLASIPRAFDRILPVRREILLGVLHCDLVGFHTYDYARHFLSSCTRILGLPTMPNGAEFEGRYVHVGTYPIGIEPAQFIDGLARDAVKTRMRALERRFEGVKIIVGVDRLDYIKGIPQKLHALETFLQEHPEWVGKVSRMSARSVCQTPS